MEAMKDDDKEKRNGSWLLMKCSSHASVEGGIPDDVVSEVLTRIPIKNVFQCKSVSKSWRSIIRDSSFLRAYNARNPSPGGLLVYKYRKADDGHQVSFHYASLRCLDGEEKGPVEQFVKFLDMPMKHYDAFTQVVNGLTCFYSCNRVSLCNLATREIIRLPNPPWVEEKGYTINASICYLGFDPINQVYKVLRISKVSRLGVFAVKLDEVNNCYSRMECHILTLTKSNGGCYSWRKLSDVEPFRFQTKSWLVNAGAVYWMKPNPVRADFARVITCFDFSEEKFHFLEFPESARQHFQPCVLVRYALVPYKDRLSLLFFVGCRLILYTLEDQEGHAWTRQEVMFPNDCTCCPVGNLPTGEIVLVAPTLEYHTPIYAYNHEINKFVTFVVGKLPYETTFTRQMEGVNAISYVSQKVLPWKL